MSCHVSMRPNGFGLGAGEKNDFDDAKNFRCPP